MGTFTYPKRSEHLLTAKELHPKELASLIKGVAILKRQSVQVSFDSLQMICNNCFKNIYHPNCFPR